MAAAQELIADVPPLRDELELKRMAMARLGKQVVDLEHVSVRFDDKTILDDVDWIIGPGDRYGIVGENGTGKTTLLRVIQGLQRPNAGEVKIGKTVRFAVLSQHLEDVYKRQEYQRAIKDMEFTVAIDYYMRPWTHDLVDMLLPAAMCYERMAPPAIFGRKIFHRDPVVKPMGQCREDWQIILEIG